jgi:hypothetical protein
MKLIKECGVQEKNFYNAHSCLVDHEARI